jgi:tRNA (cmo5U34)-methyltransferase
MSFDFIAPLYDRLATLVFGNTLTVAQQWCAERVPLHSRVLVLGGGTAALLPRVMAAQPQRVLYLEASAAMLDLARQRMEGSPATELIDFRHGTEADLTAHDVFDVIMLPFVLDLYTEQTLSRQLIPRLIRALAEPGMLLICDFEQPKTRWQRLQLWTMIRFFRVVADLDIRQLPDWPTLLLQIGFVDMEHTFLRNGQVRLGRWHRAIPFPAPGIPPSAN